MSSSIRFLLFALCGALIACSQMKDIPESSSFDMSSNSAWELIDSLEQKGLYRSALDELDGIYAEAEKSKDFQTQYKALCYQLKYAARVDDGSEKDAIDKLVTIAGQAEMPLSAIAHSMAAEAYWNYFQQHQWQIIGRTANAGAEELEFWDLKQFVDHVDDHFTASLSQSDALKAIQVVDLHPDIVVNQDQDELRPSLYEILAYRALDFYSHQHSQLTRPKSFFNIDSPDFYAPAASFKQMALGGDSTAFGYRALEIYQTLLQLQEENSEAWLSTDLARLRYVSRESSLADKTQITADDFLLRALDEASKLAPQKAILAEYDFERASSYQRSAAADYQMGVDPSKKKHYITANRICEEIIRDYPESRGAIMAQNMLLDNKTKQLNILTEDVVIPEAASLASITYRNIDQLWFRAVPVDYGFRKNWNTEELIKELIKRPVAAEWQQTLPESDDFHVHSAEAKVPALEPGYYYILCSTEPEWKNVGHKSASALCVTDISLSMSNRIEGGLLLELRHRNRGTVLQGAEVIHSEIIYGRKRIKAENRVISKQSSDSKGQVKTDRLDRGYYREHLEVKWQGQVYHADISTPGPQGPDRNYQTLSLFTDRSIYRPGQTVYFKGICMQVKGKETEILPNQTLSLTLKDANYQEVETIELRSNEFGSIAGSYTLPSSGLTGQMSIRSTLGGISFSVEEYKRPKFEVKVDPLEGVYALGGQVAVTGIAEGYSGAPISGAELRYNISRKPVRSWSYWGWWYRPAYTQEAAVQVSSGVIETDEQGRYDFSFEAVAASQSGQDLSHYAFEIKIEVTDINGETREAQSSVNIGDKGLLLNTTLPQDIDLQSLPSVEISATNLNGQAVPMSGQWELRYIAPRAEDKTDRLWTEPQFQGIGEDEFKEELMRFSPFKEQGKSHDEGMLLNSGEWNSAVSTDWDISALKGQKPGRYLLKLIAQDGMEPTIYVASSTLYDSKSEALAYSEPVKVVNVGGVYLPGDQAHIMLSSQWTDIPVRLRLEHDQELVWEKEIVLDQNQQHIKFPILSEYQEGLYLHVTAKRHNRDYNQTTSIEVTPIDRVLDLSLETYRDKMKPGSEEEWRIKVKASNGDKAMSELLMSMYDASLDQFKMHSWSFNPWRATYSKRGVQVIAAHPNYASVYQANTAPGRTYPSALNYPELARFGYEPSSYYGYHFAGNGRALRSTMSMDMAAAPEAEFAAVMEEDSDGSSVVAIADTNGASPPQEPAAKEHTTTQGEGTLIRSNLAETAFFYPQLKTDKQGGLVFSFTMPEALTRWKFQALAHSKKLQSGVLSKEVVTQKELMVIPNSPRFLREGDQISLSTKLVSLTDEPQAGDIRLEIIDPKTGKDITAQMFRGTTLKPFALKAQSSEAFEWSLYVPDTYLGLTYRFIAEGKRHSDGEEGLLPVLSDRMLVTETMPFAILKESEKSFSFDRMALANESTTVKPHALTLEFTANPVWYVVQSMPYMMEYPYDCSEQVFTRYYANALAGGIIKDRPRLRQVISAWKDLSPDAFLSNLEKNQELKYVLLEETPWVMEATSESERKKRLSLLLDLNHMTNRQKQALDKLKHRQTSSGAWAWFDGMRPNLYITQYIVSGLGHLKQLGLLDEDAALQQMINRAISYLDAEHQDRFERMKRHNPSWREKNNTGHFEIQYLYARSFFTDMPPQTEAFNYYKEQAGTYWLDRAVYMQGMSALALHRLGEAEVAKDIMRSVKEQAMQDEALGMYWKDQSRGYYWYQAGVERHALMVEAFAEVMDDQEAVYGLKQWLIFNKQTNDWKTTRATADACYALLLGGQDWTQERDWSLSIGKETFSSDQSSVSSEAGTGYLKHRWEGAEIKPEMKDVSVSKGGEAPAWGAVYYQYFEQMDKITASENSLQVSKQLFKIRKTGTGDQLAELDEGAELKRGDRVRVRMEISTDRAMEYIHIKDMRSSGMEPVDVLSGMVYSGGLGFYRSTRDASTNFFIDYMGKGSYVLEYDLFVSHKGDFSNGITSVQCMYAPEFTSHSEGIRVTVKD